MADDGVKRRGRPSMPKEEKKGGNLTFRTRDNLRSQLEDAAQISGRSVSEEIEYRLQISFDRKSVALQIYGENQEKLIEAINFIFSTTKSSVRHSDSVIFMAAISSMLAASGCTYQQLIEKNIDPSVWLFLSQAGISRACDLDLEAAAKEAERVVPEMADRMAEYRDGVAAFRRAKQAKAK